MAPISKTLALAGALFAVSGVARPVEKRAVVWETVTDVVWTTIDVTTTIYPNQPTATSTVAAVTTPAVPSSESEAPSTPTQLPVQEKQKQEPAPTSSSTTQPAAPPAPATTQEPTSSATPEPTPEPQTQPQPQPSVPAEPSTTSTSSAHPAATTTASSGDGSSGYNGACSQSSPCTGQMTFYDTATLASNPSSCGTTNDGGSEMVLALPHGIMTDNDCGKSVKITYKGITQSAKVVDKCMGCDNSSVDLSRALFLAFASLSEGRLQDAEWYIE